MGNLGRRPFETYLHLDARVSIIYSYQQLTATYLQLLAFVGNLLARVCITYIACIVCKAHIVNSFTMHTMYTQCDKYTMYTMYTM